MILRTLADLEALGRIKFPADESFRSARFLTAADGFGFSYNENRVRKGTVLDVWLKHHWEANFIVSGEGTVTDLSDGREWPLTAGTLYVVGPNDRHRLTFTEDECHISIFHPPLTGEERFDADGSYEPSGPIPRTDRRMFVRHTEALREENKEGVSKDGTVRTLPLLTAADGVGFSLSEVRLDADAVYTAPSAECRQVAHIMSGRGELTASFSGHRSELAPNMVVGLPSGTKHDLRAATEMRLLEIAFAAD